MTWSLCWRARSTRRASSHGYRGLNQTLGTAACSDLWRIHRCFFGDISASLLGLLSCISTFPFLRQYSSCFFFCFVCLLSHWRYLLILSVSSRLAHEQTILNKGPLHVSLKSATESSRSLLPELRRACTQSERTLAIVFNATLLYSEHLYFFYRYCICWTSLKNQKWCIYAKNNTDLE